MEGSTMKRFFVSAAVVAIAAIGIPVATAASAGAVPPPGGCPPGTSPTGVGWFPPQPLADHHDPNLDVGNIHDQNGDGLVCVRINPGLTRKFRPPRAWTVKDNNNKVS
jgi:hypothetical protein